EATWLSGETYRIYRSVSPITAESLSTLKPIAEVGKNSAVFYSNRYHEPGSSTWKPRYLDRLAVHDGGAEVPAGWGLLVWTLSPQDFGGAAEGEGYYAVTLQPKDGPEQFNPRSIVGPIKEAVAEPSPVDITASSGVKIGMGGHVFIQFMDLRNWNPTFHAPNPTNEYYGLDSSNPGFRADLQYAYDYDVFVPDAKECGGTLPAKLPIFVHLHGYKANAKGGEGEYPDAYCAYGIYPFDESDTWYYGFARKFDYRLGGSPAAGDTIENYTEQRVLRMIYDLERNPLGPPVDEERIYVAGQSMGGTGSLAFAERYPNVFAAAYASQPMTDFRTAGVADYGADWIKDATSKWGSPELNLPVAISAPNQWAAALQGYDGRGVWDWENLSRAASGQGLTGEMAPVGISHGTKDTVVWFGSQGKPLYTDLNEGKRAWAGLINDQTHLWQYYAGLPPSLAKLWSGVPFWDLKVIRDETVPGISNLSGNGGLPPDGAGTYNMTVKWSSSWDSWKGAPVDELGRWQMTFCAVKVGTWDCGTGAVQTADITLRRLQHFIVKPGVKYVWENWRLSDNVRIGLGEVTAGTDGLLTIPSVIIFPWGSRLFVYPA
ncbi:MAG TPA: prolyl oligopeptidase family serine peptidase, partial [Anaerolineales bacterium]